MWTALCLPTDGNSKDGFVTEDEAIQWICDNAICSMCKDEGWGSACAAEWLVVETEKLEECENLADIFDAAGMIRMDY